ncbi:MAG: hypothetical protein COA78_36820 [Blastopirellula sp.]|nr:MAG: hypothetical protein COA78_36820 [Blastopirellula sp.]
MVDVTIDTVSNDDEQTVNDNLGVPDFYDLMEDDDAEITSDDVGGSSAKAQKGLKPSYAIRKFMPMIFTVIAKRRGEHWLLDEEEVDELAEAVDDCMEHYYPDAPNLPPWAMLVFAGGSIALPRIMMDDLTDDEKKLVGECVNAQLTDSSAVKPAQMNHEKAIGHGTVLRPKAG